MRKIKINSLIKIIFTLFIFISMFFIFISSSNDIEYQLNVKNDILIYFTQPFKYKYGESPIERKILQLLDQANKEVYIFAFDIDDAPIINKLIEIQKNGIKINIIVDPDNTPEKVVSILKHFNMLIPYDPPKLMHHKIILIDDNISTLGSMNFTFNGIYFNNNDFIVIKNHKINSFLKKYFLFLAGKISNCQSSIDLVINNIPISIHLTRCRDKDVNSIIKEYIKQAKKSLFFAYSTFTNVEIAKLIIQQIQDKNLYFYGILEKRNSYSKYSVYNLFEANRLKIYRDENDAIMHLKLLIIDDFTITGSYAIANRSNMKGFLNKYNDDLIIIFKSKEISNFYSNYIKHMIFK